MLSAPQVFIYYLNLLWMYVCVTSATQSHYVYLLQALNLSLQPQGHITINQLQLNMICSLVKLLSQFHI